MINLNVNHPNTPGFLPRVPPHVNRFTNSTIVKKIDESRDIASGDWSLQEKKLSKIGERNGAGKLAGSGIWPISNICRFGM